MMRRPRVSYSNVPSTIRTCFYIVTFIIKLHILSTNGNGFKVFEVPTSTTSDLDGGGLQFLTTSTSPEIQQHAVEGLITRLLPDRHSEFVILINSTLTPASTNQDAFTIEYDTDHNETRRVVITGTTGVAAAYAFNHYLKHVCNAQVAWEGSQGLNSLPNPLPPPPPKLQNPVPILDRFRYYLNACTESYSMVWWNWTRYEKEIDWMAMQGVNLPLVALGQEAIWWRVWRKFGFMPQEVSTFLTGPAFFAWGRMGNLQSWGGPPPAAYMNSRLDLFRRIVTRMREFGMVPVLPTFSGSVPETAQSRFPNATIVQRGSWSHFNSTYSTWFLEPTDPLFARISSAFRQELEAEVGKDSIRVYSCDTFNENRPTQNDTTYLKNVATATYDAMRGDKDQVPVIWVMQAWVFNYDREFWSADKVRAYLSGVDVGNLLLLDLMADVNPAYIRFNSFYGHSFIWCMLQNFGGASVLYGTMELINVGIPIARNISHPGSMVGLGIVPEGIEQNYVMYDFMSDMMIYSNQMIDTKTWIKNYARRRYGDCSSNTTAMALLQDAWVTLESGVYNAYPWIRSNSHTILSGRPGLNRTQEHWYKLQDVVSVLGNFLSVATMMGASKTPALLRYDIVDVTRQFLQHKTELLYYEILRSYYKGNVTDLRVWRDYYDRNETDPLKSHANQFLDVIADLDLLLSTHTAFMTGKWVKEAERWGETERERSLLRFNALNQITSWGPTGEIVDYAAKQWSGTIGIYAMIRWVLFIHDLKAALASGKPFDEKKYNQRVLQVEIPFAHFETTFFPDQAKGDSVAVAKHFYDKWIPLYEASIENQFKFKVRGRGRGQQLIPDKKRFQKWLRRKEKCAKTAKKENVNWNKKLAHFYLKQMTQHRRE